MGARSEFYLFKNDGEGNPTDVPFDNAGFMDAAPEDKGEDVRREICLTLEDMGVTPQSSHHSGGPGQNIIEFCHSSAVHAADDVITYKSVVKTMAAHNGLTASFDPIPIPGKDGNGFHITLTPMLREKDCSENFLAGILAHAAEITAILNPTADSYRRLGVFGAPEFVSWSEKSRRCFAYKKAGQPAIEVRSPDSTTNPYLAYAALIYAGLDGYLKRTKLPKPDAARETSEKLPKSAEEALQVFEKSSFIRNVFPEYFVRTFIQTLGARGRACERGKADEKRYYPVQRSDRVRRAAGRGLHRRYADGRRVPARFLRAERRRGAAALPAEQLRPCDHQHAASR